MYIRFRIPNYKDELDFYFDSDTLSVKSNEVKEIIDYKFFCFNGEPKMLYVSQGMEHHETARISFVDLDWNQLPYHRNDYAPFNVLPPKPKQLSEMVAIAKRLSAGIPFVRVDLYALGDDITLFSEFAFYPCGGLIAFVPNDADIELGKYLDISKVRIH